jgi:hypothetical protein
MSVLSIAASERRRLSTTDIGSAYLNAVLDTEVIMMLDVELAALVVAIWPELSGYLDHRGRAYVRLMKALYGCIESSKLWYIELRKALESFGFVANKEDPCVFNKIVDGIQTTLCVHVDDILCTSVKISEHIELERNLTDRFKDINFEQGSITSFLGMTIHTSDHGPTSICMAGFVSELVNDFAPTGSVPSPANNQLFEPGHDDHVMIESERKRFHTVVAKLLYLAKRIRPDILVAVSYLCTRVTVATDRDLDKLNRVLKYLSGTMDQRLTLYAEWPLCVHAYVDASYGVHEDAKSHTGVYLTLGRGAVLGKSNKQKIVTKSSTEAELVAVTDSVGEIVWLRNFLIEQGYEMPPAVLYQDNQSTIALLNRGGSGHRTKHIKIRIFFVKELIDAGEVVVRYMPTDEMVADVLTKPLQGKKFTTIRETLIGETVVEIRT